MKLHALLGSLVLASASAAFAQSSSIHGAVGGIMTVRASQVKVEKANGSRQVVLITSQLDMPTVDKQKNDCARMPDYGDGAICFRVCNPEPDRSVSSTPVSWAYAWRPANANGKWQACDEASGCAGFNPEYFEDEAHGCGHFKVWKKQGGPRDLMLTITLGPQTEADRTRIAAFKNPSKVKDPLQHPSGLTGRQVPK